MSGTTTNYSLPYPTGGDALNVAADIQALAEGCDVALKNAGGGTSYTLPLMDSDTRGGAKCAGAVSTIDSANYAAVGSVYTDANELLYMPTATTTKAGAIKSANTLAVTPSSEYLGCVCVDASTGLAAVNRSSTSIVGCGKVNGTIADADTTNCGEIWIGTDDYKYWVRPLSTSALGAVKANAELANSTSYCAPCKLSGNELWVDHASSTQYGVIKPDANTCIVNSNTGILTAKTPTAIFYATSSPTFNKTNTKLTIGRQYFTNSTFLTAASGGFYVAHTGLYLITATIGYTGATSGDSVHICLYQSSTMVNESWGRNAGTSGCVQYTRVNYLDAGVYYYIYVSNQTAARGTIDGGTDGSTSVSVTLLS